MRKVKKKCYKKKRNREEHSAATRETDTALPHGKQAQHSTVTQEAENSGTTTTHHSMKDRIETVLCTVRQVTGRREVI